MAQIQLAREKCRLLSIDICELELDILELQISKDFLHLQLAEEREKLNLLETESLQQQENEITGSEQKEQKKKEEPVQESNNSTESTAASKQPDLPLSTDSIIILRDSILLLKAAEAAEKLIDSTDETL